MNEPLPDDIALLKQRLAEQQAQILAPAVWFAYSPDRKGAHPQTHLAGFSGVLQADAYAGSTNCTAKAI